MISYELYTQNTEQVIRELEAFIDLKNPLPIPEVKTGSLQKWRVELSEEEFTQIQCVVGLHPDTIDDNIVHIESQVTSW